MTTPTKPGRFDGDLAVNLLHNALDAWYEVRVLEWVELPPIDGARRGRWATVSPILHNFPSRQFKSRDRATKYYLKVYAERKRRRIARRHTDAVEAGWRVLA